MARPSARTAAPELKAQEKGTLPFSARARLRRRLVAWYRRQRRALPWRETRDPYAVWVSETMLQQTRVETVLRYYARFLERFPTVAALARASTASVLARWSGLGYYSRARNLHAAAREIVRRHGGAIPADPSALGALPGIGRYTLGAVGSIAFGLSLPIVDGNVSRVFARLFAIDRPLAASDAELWRLAAELVPARGAGDWNQALMELGATVCTPRRPDCARCPLADDCLALARGLTEVLPRARPRPSIRSVRRAIAAVEADGRWFLTRRDEGRLLHGLWEFPGIDLDDGVDTSSALAAAFRRQSAVAARGLREIGVIRHTILDCRIETRVFHGQAAAPSRRPGWIAQTRIRSLPLSAAGLRALELLAQSRKQASAAS